MVFNYKSIHQIINQIIYWLCKKIANNSTRLYTTPVHLWPLLSFSNFSNDGPLIMFLPNTFVKLSDNFRKKIISESPQWFCRKSQLWQEVYSAHLQLWTSNAQVIKTRQQAIELHGLVTWKYSVAQRVCLNNPTIQINYHKSLLFDL